MSSKTSIKWFWHFILLFAMIATGFGCGSGGGGGNSNKPDASAPRFTGLEGATSDNNGNVVLTAPEATDDQSSAAEMSYLIYVATSPEGVQRTGETPYVFTGADVCTGGQCAFTLTDLTKDGTTTYYFGSHARDASGKLDEDAHPTEGTLQATPLVVAVLPPPGNNGGGGVIASSSLNIDPALHAVHPALAVVGEQRYVIWEECTPALPGANGWENDHPCDHATPSKIHIRQGANWDLLTDQALGGRSDLTQNPSSHGHNPTLAYDGATLYAAWKERGTPSNLFVRKFDQAGWSDTGFPDTESDDRPALTRHPLLGNVLGMAYERSSPTPPGQKHLLFRQMNGGWQSNIGPLNQNAGFSAEAPIFSKKGDQLYITWKENTTAAPGTPNVFVKRWNNGSSTWEAVGSGPLNLNPAMEARYPSIDVSGNVPYVAWHECSDAGCGREHIFVKHWDGSQWIQDKDTGACGADPNCGSLNVNSRFAKTPSLAVHNDKVYVAWSERDFVTNKFAVRIKRLDGNTWVPLTLPQELFVNNAHAPILYANGSLHIAWVEENEAGVLQLIVAKLG
ncbi:MAG: hypothetical protein MCM46_13375 [Candidatus Manganitrophus sp. SB1]|nr:hypothetical protein [Candidatus Manganitrophus morganii]